MIVTDRFVYVHMPKTGGTFVEEAVRRLFDGESGLYIDTSVEPWLGLYGLPDQHQTVAQIPRQFRDRPVAFTIRNPFDHYVSFYEFAWWKKAGDSFHLERVREAYLNFPKLKFEEYLRACFDPRLADPNTRSEPAKAMLDEVGIGPLTYDYIRFLYDSPEPVIRSLQKGIVPALPTIEFLRMERLNAQLSQFLKGVGYPCDRVKFVNDLPKIFPAGSKRKASGSWRSYYTAETLSLVRDKEWPLFEWFNEYA